MVAAVGLGHSEAHLRKQGCEGCLGVSGELVDLNLPDSELGVDSLSGIDLVFEEGLVVVLLIKLELLASILDLEILSQSCCLLFIEDSLLLLGKLILHFLNLKQGFSLESLKLKVILLVVVFGLLLISLDSFIVSCALLFGLVKLISLSSLHI